MTEEEAENTAKYYVYIKWDATAIYNTAQILGLKCKLSKSFKILNRQEIEDQLINHLTKQLMKMNNYKLR
jgi:hypothetical protein